MKTLTIALTLAVWIATLHVAESAATQLKNPATSIDPRAPTTEWVRDTLRRDTPAPRPCVVLHVRNSVSPFTIKNATLGDLIEGCIVVCKPAAQNEQPLRVGDRL